jgi:periplasmic protein CpxP/Spy
MTYFFAPVARTFAIASLTGAALLAGSVAPTWAQTADSKDNKTPPAAAAATSTKAETVEQRIVTLKTALKITPDQEPKWTAVAQAMRDSSVQMEKLVATKRAIPPEKTTAVDDLKTYQEFTEVRLEGLKKVNSAFKSLYDSMPAEQKKNADMVFEKYGPTKSNQG